MRNTRRSFVAVAALFVGAVLWPGSLFNGPAAESVPLAASTTASGSVEFTVDKRDHLPAESRGRPSRLFVSPPDIMLADLDDDLSPSELRHPPELPVPPILSARRN